MKKSIDKNKYAESLRRVKAAREGKKTENNCENNNENLLRRIAILLVAGLALAAASLWLLFGGEGGSIYKPTEEQTESTEKLQGNPGLTVSFIDVGQGACVLIVCDGKAMLIDGGPDAKGTYIRRFLKNKGTEGLEYAVGTHFDADHVGGLDSVLYKYDCKKLMLPDYTKDSASYRNIFSVGAEKNMKTVHPKAGDVYALGGGSFTVIAPVNAGYEDENDYSIGLIFSYGEKKFIFTGDATAFSEKEMLENFDDLRADVLFVGHHGSSTSTSEEFLEAVSPETAVISCGAGNDYGHPHQQVLNRLEKAGIKVYRTDLNGTVTALCDGKNIVWQTEKEG